MRFAFAVLLGAPFVLGTCGPSDPRCHWRLTDEERSQLGLCQAIVGIAYYHGSCHSISGCGWCGTCGEAPPEWTFEECQEVCMGIEPDSSP